MSINKVKGNMYQDIDATWNPIGGECEHKCTYCLGEDTLILMYNSSWKRIKNIEVGDKIVGFSTNNEGRIYYHTTMVLNKMCREAEAAVIKTNFSEVIASLDHKWLTIYGWVPTSNLNLNSRIRTATQKVEEYVLNEVDDFKKGYLTGMIEGDGLLKTYNYSDSTTQHQFRLVLKDNEALERTERYLKYFNITVKQFIFKNRNEHYPAIRTSSRECFEKITTLITKPGFKSAQWNRGYLSGIYDAEGSMCKNYHSKVIRIHNSDEEIISTIKKALDNCGFDYIREDYKSKCHSVRLLGGRNELLRFIYFIDPAITRKRMILQDGRMKGNTIVKKIESIGKVNLYDIETSSTNFIANGLASHNCYMKRMWNMMKDNSIQLKESFFDDNLGKNKRIFVGSSTDMFAENVPAEWIKRVLTHLSKNYPDNIYLYQTKNPRRFNVFQYRLSGMCLVNKMDVILGTTIETNRQDEVSKISKAPSVIERADAIRSFSTRGWTTQVTIEPVMDFDELEMIELIEWAKPKKVYIGADSQNSKLPEPLPSKILDLFYALATFAQVKLKKNLARLLDASQIGE